MIFLFHSLLFFSDVHFIFFFLQFIPNKLQVYVSRDPACIHQYKRTNNHCKLFHSIIHQFSLNKFFSTSFLAFFFCLCNVILIFCIALMRSLPIYVYDVYVCLCDAYIHLFIILYLYIDANGWMGSQFIQFMFVEIHSFYFLQAFYSFL